MYLYIYIYIRIYFHHFLYIHIYLIFYGFVHILIHLYLYLYYICIYQKYNFYILGEHPFRRNGWTKRLNETLRRETLTKRLSE